MPVLETFLSSFGMRQSRVGIYRSECGMDGADRKVECTLDMLIAGVVGGVGGDDVLLFTVVRVPCADGMCASMGDGERSILLVSAFLRASTRSSKVAGIVSVSSRLSTQGVQVGG